MHSLYMTGCATSLQCRRARGSSLIVLLTVQAAVITRVALDYVLDHTRRIAVNSHFICYSLKGGQIRVLHKNKAARALLKGASKPADLRCVAKGDACLNRWSSHLKKEVAVNWRMQCQSSPCSPW